VPYDVAIWAGPPPLNDASAEEEFERRIEILEDGDQRSPASPALEAFLDELLSLLPRLGGANDGASPWNTGPEPGDISGDFAYLTMTFPGARAALDTIIEVARRHRVVCFDPQLAAVLEPPGGTNPASNPSGLRSLREGKPDWIAEGSTTERTYPAVKALEILGCSNGLVKRLTAIGLPDRDRQTLEEIVALIAAAQVLTNRETAVPKEEIPRLVKQVATVLREHPSGSGVVLRVVGDLYEVAPRQLLGPIPENRPGSIHEYSLDSYVSTARQNLSW